MRGVAASAKSSGEAVRRGRESDFLGASSPDSFPSTRFALRGSARHSKVSLPKSAMIEVALFNTFKKSRSRSHHSRIFGANGYPTM